MTAIQFTLDAETTVATPPEAQVRIHDVGLTRDAEELGYSIELWRVPLHDATNRDELLDLQDRIRDWSGSGVITAAAADASEQVIRQSGLLGLQPDRLLLDADSCPAFYWFPAPNSAARLRDIEYVEIGVDESGRLCLLVARANPSAFDAREIDAAGVRAALVESFMGNA